MTRRPLSITVLAGVYIVTGAVGFLYHFPELTAGGRLVSTVGVELIRLLAVVCGIFLLRGREWARWVALAWIAFHTGVSALHNAAQFAMHAALCAAITVLLFRPAASRFFRATGGSPGG